MLRVLLAQENHHPVLDLAVGLSAPSSCLLRKDALSEYRMPASRDMELDRGQGLRVPRTGNPTQPYLSPRQHILALLPGEPVVKHSGMFVFLQRLVIKKRQNWVLSWCPPSLPLTPSAFGSFDFTIWVFSSPGLGAWRQGPHQTGLV